MGKGTLALLKEATCKHWRNKMEMHSENPLISSALWPSSLLTRPRAPLVSAVMQVASSPSLQLPHHSLPSTLSSCPAFHITQLSSHPVYPFLGSSCQFSPSLPAPSLALTVPSPDGHLRKQIHHRQSLALFAQWTHPTLGSPCPVVSRRSTQTTECSMGERGIPLQVEQSGMEPSTIGIGKAAHHTSLPWKVAHGECHVSLIAENLFRGGTIV